MPKAVRRAESAYFPRNLSDRRGGALGFGHRREIRLRAGRGTMSSAQALRALLDEAYAAMRDGEAAEAERRARAVSALIRAEKELAELSAAQEQEPEDNAGARAQLLSWITGLVAAHRAGASDEELERLASEPPGAGVELRGE